MVCAELNMFLLWGALLSAIAAALHVGIIAKGASWYRFFGAGERFAQAAERGERWPDLVTALITIVLVGWAAYALSGAGAITPLPFLREGLFAITAVYLLRGLAIIPIALFARNQLTPFALWSSVICIGYGAVHAIGLTQVWSRI